MEATPISHIGEKVGQTATVRGWLYNKRSSGKIQFLIVRDGTGYLQAVVAKAEVKRIVDRALELLLGHGLVRVLADLGYAADRLELGRTVAALRHVGAMMPQ